MESELGEQLGTALREPDKGPTLVQHQPAALDRQIQTGLVRRTFLSEQERAVDQLDVDFAILHGLDAVAISTILRAAFSGPEYGRAEAKFHMLSLIA